MVWHCGRFRFSWSSPLIMGVVNVTPDSFSDGGCYVGETAAVSRALQLREDGADIIDVGGESTRPGAAPVDGEEEKRRVLPVIEKLARQEIAVSVDTRNPEVMRAALDSGAAIINDVGGFCDPRAMAAVAESRCGLVIVHMQGEPRTMQDNPHYDNVVSEVRDFLQAQTAACERQGIDKERICWDAGIGFGKTARHNWLLLRRFSDLRRGYPLLLGVSRKSLFAAVTPRAAPLRRDWASVACAAIMVGQGANLVRAHNVAATRDALAVAAELAAEGR